MGKPKIEKIAMITNPLPDLKTVAKQAWKILHRNRNGLIGLCLVSFFTFIALAAPLLSPHDPSQIFPDSLRLPPCWAEGGDMRFFFGTDDVGRDILSRLIHGARISMIIGFFVVSLAMVIGTLLGLVAGYFEGRTDRFIMRIIDIIMALPSILLAMVVVSILGPGIKNAIVAVAVVAIPGFTRLVRASVLSEKEKEYVVAAKSIGSGHLRTMFKEILPNCMAPIIVQSSLGFSDGILNAAALGFLGLGAQPPTPEWGTMLADARAFIESSPWMVSLPGLCILLVVLGFNLMGDGLRDALDPRMKGR